jgi:hypothetical protein
MEGYTTNQLKAMLNKSSGATADEVRAAIRELKRRGEATPPPEMVTGGRRKAGPLPKPKARMAKGGYANCGASMKPTQKSTTKMAAGGMLKKPDNPGLAKLPTAVRNKMGYMAKGGYAKKK